MVNEEKQFTIQDLENSASLRKTFSANEQKTDVDVQALHIDAASAESDGSHIDFSWTTDVAFQEDQQLHYWRLFLRLMTITGLSILGIIVAYAMYAYTARLAQPSIPESIKPYVYTVHDTYKTVLWYLWAKNYKQLSSLSLIWDDTSSVLDRIVLSSLNFIDKKYILQRELSIAAQQYIQNNQQVEDMQRDVAQYGYLPQEVVNIFQDSNMQVSLQRWLIALEAIKFTTAIKVFSYLDTFVVWLADYLSVSPTYVKEQMQKMSNRGEQDIYAFLSNCYMNPYELSYDCGVVGDFDARYATQKDTWVDPAFFKQVLYYIDQKLEQTQIPSFSIVFQKFDPRAETISFSIEVNTFQQDEAALVDAGIVNPHIFIVTSVIHLLQQSRFIQWSSIDAKQINIQPKIVKIGANQFVVNNSVLQYTLPIQKDVAREIDDFDTQ